MILFLGITSAAAITGGVIYRARGGWGPKLPRPLYQTLFSLPVLTGLFIGNAPWWGVLVAFVATISATLTGHASHMDLGRIDGLSHSQPADGERFEWYSRWLPKSWSPTLLDSIGLVLKGSMMALPTFAILLFAGSFTALPLLFGPAMLAAYATGWFIHPRLSPIAVGEWLTGGLLWALWAMTFLTI